jgi:hypothetical protein
MQPHDSAPHPKGDSCLRSKVPAGPHARAPLRKSWTLRTDTPIASPGHSRSEPSPRGRSSQAGRPETWTAQSVALDTRRATAGLGQAGLAMRPRLFRCSGESSLETSDDRCRRSLCGRIVIKVLLLPRCDVLFSLPTPWFDRLLSVAPTFAFILIPLPEVIQCVVLLGSHQSFASLHPISSQRDYYLNINLRETGC